MDWIYFGLGTAEDRDIHTALVKKGEVFGPHLPFHAEAERSGLWACLQVSGMIVTMDTVHGVSGVSQDPGSALEVWLSLSILFTTLWGLAL